MEKFPSVLDFTNLGFSSSLRSFGRLQSLRCVCLRVSCGVSRFGTNQSCFSVRPDALILPWDFAFALESG